MNLPALLRLVLGGVLVTAAPSPTPAQDAVPPDLETILMGTSFLLDDEALAEIGDQGRFGVYPIDTRGRLITIQARLVAPGFVRARILASKDGGPVRVIEGERVGEGPEARTVVEFVENLEPGQWEFAFGAPTTRIGAPEDRRLEIQLLLATRDAQRIPEDPDFCTAIGYVIAHATSAWMLCQGELVEQDPLGSAVFTGGVRVPGAQRVFLEYGDAHARRGAVYRAEFYRGDDPGRANAVYEDTAMLLSECGLDWPEETSSHRAGNLDLTLRRWKRQDGVEMELELGIPRAGSGTEAAVSLRVLPPEGL